MITLSSNPVHLRLSVIIKSFVHILKLKIILISWTRWNSYNNKICKAGLALHNPTILSFQLDSLEYKVILLLLLLDVVVGNIKGHYCYLLLQHRSQIVSSHYLKQYGDSWHIWRKLKWCMTFVLLVMTSKHFWLSPVYTVILRLDPKDL